MAGVERATRAVKICASPLFQVGKRSAVLMSSLPVFQ